jgi:hypothetical protein
LRWGTIPDLPDLFIFSACNAAFVGSKKLPNR